MTQQDSVPVIPVANSDTASKVYAIKAAPSDSTITITRKKAKKSITFNKDRIPFIKETSKDEGSLCVVKTDYFVVKPHLLKIPYSGQNVDRVTVARPVVPTNPSGVLNQSNSLLPDSVKIDSTTISIPSCIALPNDSLKVEADTVAKSNFLLINHKFGSIDSFNRANDLQRPVTFKYSPDEPEKTYFDRSEYVQVQSPNSVKMNWGNEGWYFWSILAIVSYLAWTRFKNAKFINQTMNAVWDNHLANRMFREKNERISTFILKMLLVYYLTAGLFCYQALHYFSGDTVTLPGLVLFLVFSFSLAVIHAIKIVVLRIVGHVFDRGKLTQEYIHNVNLSYITTGIILLPVVLAIPYLNAYVIPEFALIVCGISIYYLAFLQRLLRGVIISIQQNVSILYIFLYLCALEIIPLALVVKLIFDVSKNL